jgi:predicted RNase H-like nuclease
MSSVFPAPDPRVVDASTFEEASERSRSLTGKGVSKQGFAIYAKIAEVNRAMTPLLQSWVAEIHPEVSFWALNRGNPMAHHKSMAEGYEERRALLAAALGVAMATRSEAARWARPAVADDILDAVVAAWSAERIATGRGGRLPDTPVFGAGGLRMEIAY